MEKSFGLRWRVSEKSSLATRGRVRTEPRRVLAGRLLAHSRGTSGRPALVFPPGHGPEVTRIGEGQWVGDVCKVYFRVGLCVCVSCVCSCALFVLFSRARARLDVPVGRELVRFR